MAKGAHEPPQLVGLTQPTEGDCDHVCGHIRHDCDDALDDALDCDDALAAPDRTQINRGVYATLVFAVAGLADGGLTHIHTSGGKLPRLPRPISKVGVRQHGWPLDLTRLLTAQAVAARFGAPPCNSTAGHLTGLCRWLLRQWRHAFGSPPCNSTAGHST